MLNNISRLKVAEVEEKYIHLEDYMKDYIDSLAYNAKRRLTTLYYLKHHGILLSGEDLYIGFPSYNHWRFNHRFKLYQHHGLQYPSFFSS